MHIPSVPPSLRPSWVIASIALLAMGATQDRATAQFVTVNSDYAAGPPPTSSPFGTLAVPAVNDSWRIIIEFGSAPGGNFVLLPLVAGGGLPARPATLTLLFGKGGFGLVAGPNNWLVAAINLPGWPAPAAPGTLFVRARLERLNFLGLWVPINTAINGCP